LPTVREPGVVRLQGFNARASQLPCETAEPVTARHIEKLAGAPLQYRRSRSPNVEEHSRVVDC
jgi:hypothetical protein